MKKKLYVRIVSFLLCLFNLVQCTVDSEREVTSPVLDEKNVQIENDTARQIAEYIDYLNYEISKYALSKEKDSCNIIFDASTKEKQDYTSIINGLVKIRHLLKSKTQSKNELLAIKIDSLKKDTSVKINNPTTLANYITENIFNDSIKYNEVFTFDKNRITKPSDIKKENVQKDWQTDSIKYSEWKKKIRTEINEKIKNFKPDYHIVIPPKDYSVYIFLLAFILVAGLFLYSRIKRKKNENAIAKVKDKVQTAEIVSAESNIDYPKEIITLKNNIKGLHDIINKQKQEIEKLQHEIALYKIDTPITEPKIISGNISYFPAPNNSSFPAAAGYAAKRSFDAYQLEINGSTALFSLLCDDADVVKRALDSPDIYILQVCEIESNSANFGKATTIKLIEKGQLQKEGDQWILKKKSLIKLL